MSNNINRYLIEEYKGEDKIISDYYKLTKKNQTIELSGIVNPLKIDNRQLMSPTDNQKEFPACAGYSAATLIESLMWKKTGKLKQLDSLQVYQLAKQKDGSIDQYGTYLEASCQAVLELCKKDTEFSFLKDAKIGVFYNDTTIKTIDLTKHMIHKHDFIQVGFNIDEGWYDCNNSNYVLQPRGRSLGGHAVNLCGWDYDGFYVLNQWGSGWGAKGYAVIPYDVFLKQFMYGAFIQIGG
jgi:hypothetical protein